MPVTPTYPGVYIEELPSAVRTIVGVATSVTAFVGAAPRGPANEAIRVSSFAEYERLFGGLAPDSLMGHSVYYFFQNGGSQAVIVRVAPRTAAPAALDLGNNVALVASGPGEWGNRLRAEVTPALNSASQPRADAYNLAVWVEGETPADRRDEEVYRNISVDATGVRPLRALLNTSILVRPAPGGTQGGMPTVGGGVVSASGGTPGGALADADYLGSFASRTGIYALHKADIFNLLVLVPISDTIDLAEATLLDALTLCVEKRAMLLVDAPEGWNSVATAEANGRTFMRGAGSENAALYFPRVMMPDPLMESRPRQFPPAGPVAGVFARTDVQRGVWKAPAGIDATVRGVTELEVKLDDPSNGVLNPIGINCLRTFPIIGNVVWGARTLQGADQLASQWKYVPIRRLALFIEESLFRGTQWVVFEPNDEPLWSSIRLNVGAFMQGLFRQGAFQGDSPQKAYFVKCDKDTNPQIDIDRGIVNIIVGFAPLKPAEFVIIKIKQISPLEQQQA